MIITKKGGLLTIEVPHTLTPQMKTIPGTRFDRKRRVWTMPANLQALAALPSGDPVFDELNRFADRQELRRTDDRPIKGREHLYPFQAAGVRFLAGAGKVLLADEMGTGKTVQALTAVELQGHWPLLVVCPNTLKGTWEKEVRQWTDATPFVVGGTAKQRREQIQAAREHDGPKVVIINYESLILHTAQDPFGNTVLTEKQRTPGELNEIEWGAVVVDEAHRIKNPKAATTRAVWHIGRGTKMRIAMTGTPIVNNPDDLWSIMRFVAPDEYPSRSRFRDRYCIVQAGWHGGLENRGLNPQAEAEFDLLVQPRFIRRTKAEVLPELPEKILTERYVPLTKKQAKAYNELVKHMMAMVKDGVLYATDPLTLVGRLRYIANAEVVVDENSNVIAHEGDSNKLDEIDAIKADTDGPLVVYAQSAKFIRFLERNLDGAVCVTGDHTKAQRDQAIEMFQQGRAEYFLATTGAGAEGLTLVEANRLVIASEDWSNVKNKQAHDRIHRIGQERGVEIITLISEGTIEEAVHRTTGDKEARLQELVRDEEALMRAVKGQL